MRPDAESGVIGLADDNMHLISQNMGTIEWNDVVAFCDERIGENATLDYKETFPKDLEKTIAAMANTLGGLILIGVAEDKESRPIVPVYGVEFERGLSERVMSKCIDAIYPPVIPEVQVCRNEADNRAIVVVRVLRSVEVPHAIKENTRVYVRTGKQNTPEALASLDRIARLLDQRKNAENLREWIYQRASDRFIRLTHGRVPDVERSQEDGATSCLLTLSICPTYPESVPFVHAPELHAIRQKITVRETYGTAHEFPIQESGTRNRVVEDGVVMHFTGTGNTRTYHTHLNIHGLYFFKQSMLWVPNVVHEGDPPHEPAMRFSEIVNRAFCLLASAEKLYVLLGYVGPLTAQLELEKFLGYGLLFSDSSSGVSETYRRYSADEHIRVSTNTSTADLNTYKADIVHRLTQRVAWSFDWDTSLESVERVQDGL